MVGCIDRKEKDRLIRYLRTELIHGSDSKITSGNNSRQSKISHQLHGHVIFPVWLCLRDTVDYRGPSCYCTDASYNYNSRISTVQDTLYSTDVPYYVRAVLRSAKRRITGI